MDLLIGTAPDGWTERRLHEITDVVAGPSIPEVVSNGRMPGGVPVIRPRDLRNNRVADDCAASVSRDTADKLSSYGVFPYDIVLARTGQPGHHGLVSTNQAGWLVGSACIRVRTRTEVSAAYLVHYLGHPAVRDWIVRNTSGAVVPTLTTKLIGALPVAVPPPRAQSDIADVLGALDEKIVVHDEISKTTAELRDALRFRLMSGDTPNR
jgi:Type I restriction modification DNA specificity domain